MNKNPNPGGRREDKQMHPGTMKRLVAALVALSLALAVGATELPSAAQVLKETGVSAGLASVDVVRSAATLPHYDRIVNLLVADLDALGKVPVLPPNKNLPRASDPKTPVDD